MNSREEKPTKVYEYLLIDTCYLNKDKFNYQEFVDNHLGKNIPLLKQFEVRELFNGIKGIIISNEYGDVDYGYYNLKIKNNKYGFDERFNLPQCDAGHHIIIDFYEALKKGLFNHNYIDGNGWYTKVYSPKKLEELTKDLELVTNWNYYREKKSFEIQYEQKLKGKLKTLTFGLLTENLISHNMIGITDKVTIRIDEFSHLLKNRENIYQYQLFTKNGESFVITEQWYNYIKSLL